MQKCMHVDEVEGTYFTGFFRTTYKRTDTIMMQTKRALPRVTATGRIQPDSLGSTPDDAKSSNPDDSPDGKLCRPR